MNQISDDPQIIKPLLQELKKAFSTHKTKQYSFRKAQLNNLLKGFNEMKDKFHSALNADIGASKFISELTSTIITENDIKDTINNFEKWIKPRQVDTSLLIGPAKSYVLPEPLGVALVISAWNYPIYTALPPVAQAISAGNCVMLKPSEMAPHTSSVLKELFETYLDKSCYRVIEGGTQIASSITSHPFDLIIFTGSPQKGKLVAKAAAENLIPCILELGGKSPTIVDKDANMQNAALRIAQGRLLNSGQTCVACDYVMVHKDVAKEFVSKLKSTIDTFYGKNAQQSEDYNKIINEFHTERLKNMITENHGGQIVYGGKFDVKQRYIEPTLILNPSENSQIMKEEIFGPILPIVEWDNIDNVIKYVNDRPKPLALYYFGSTFNPNKEKLIQQTSSGAVSINEACFHIISGHLPFGGVGNSGLGSYHGLFGFDNCSHLKPIFDKLTLNAFPLSTRFPPYTPFKQSVLKLLFNNLNIDQSKLLHGLSYFTVMTILLVLYRNGKIDATYNQLIIYLQSLINKQSRL